MKKSVVKFVKSIHADGNVISAMVVGYIILLIVGGTIIINDNHQTKEKSVATSSLSPDQVQVN